MNNTIIQNVIYTMYGDNMEMNKAEIIKRLMSVDNDMSLLDTTADTYSCIIVGGSALVLLEKIYRSTHDIDSINASD